MGRVINLALRPTVRHSKSRRTPHSQTQQTSACAAVSNDACVYWQDSVLWYSVAGMQVCHASHYLICTFFFLLKDDITHLTLNLKQYGCASYHSI